MHGKYISSPEPWSVTVSKTHDVIEELCCTALLGKIALGEKSAFFFSCCPQGSVGIMEKNGIFSGMLMNI